MATAKLNMNIVEGRIEVEGDLAFVTKVYEDFKDRWAGHVAKTPAQPAAKAHTTTTPAKKSPAKKAAKKGSTAKAGSIWKPIRDKSLDLADLKAFTKDYSPRNAAEYILLYADYMKQIKEKEPCTIHDIYSCFIHERSPIPKAYEQAFRDTKGKGKYGFIDFTGPEDIVVSTVGINYMNDSMPKSVEKAEA